MRIASKNVWCYQVCNYSNITDRKIHKKYIYSKYHVYSATILLMVFSPIDSVKKGWTIMTKNSVKK